VLAAITAIGWSAHVEASPRGLAMWKLGLVTSLVAALAGTSYVVGARGSTVAPAAAFAELVAMFETRCTEDNWTSDDVRAAMSPSPSLA
jgi:hypothetical protein